ncbi:MAG TPA: class I tRNA ligase family protein, partial [Motiliproteus sp.]
NVLDPLDLIDGIGLEELVAKRTANMMQPQLAAKIEKQTRKEFPEGIASYGTDALRFTFCSLASTGRDIKFDMGRMEGYRNFCNKIWNAARYVLMNTEQQDEQGNAIGALDCGQHGGEVELSLADRWIISRLQRTEQQVEKAFGEFRFDLAAQALFEFIWNEYCDWYLELSKPVLWDDNASEAQLRGTRRTLVRVLETALRLAHPMMPYITEEIWQRVAPLAGQSGTTIMTQPYPLANAERIDAQAETDIEWLKGVIVGIRNIRGEMNISPAKHIPVLFDNCSSDDQRRVADNGRFLRKLANLESVTALASGDEAPLAAVQLVGEMKVLVPMAGLIDKDAELARLQKEIDKLSKEVERVGGKLNNPSFVDKAPEAVVAKERAKLEDAEKAKQELQAQHAKIAAL